MPVLQSDQIGAEKLGRLISLLEGYMKSDFQSDIQINGEDRHLFDLMVSEFYKIKQGLTSHLEFPNSCCVQDRPFLESNYAFFIAHLLFDELEESNAKHERLARHLNDCFWCFNVYCRVFKHFFICNNNIKFSKT